MVDTSMATLPRFILADRLRYRLLALMTVLAALALLLCIFARDEHQPDGESRTTRTPRPS